MRSSSYEGYYYRLYLCGDDSASQILRSHPETEVTIYDRNAVVPSIVYDINDYDDQDAEQPRLRTELSPDQLSLKGLTQRWVPL